GGKGRERRTRGREHSRVLVASFAPFPLHTRPPLGEREYRGPTTRKRGGEKLRDLTGRSEGPRCKRDLKLQHHKVRLERIAMRRAGLCFFVCWLARASHLRMSRTCPSPPVKPSGGVFSASTCSNTHSMTTRF